MKSTKYQLLKHDFDFACKQLKEYRLIIEDLRIENEELKRQLKYKDRTEYIGKIPKKSRIE